MSTNTTNMAMGKAVDGDNARTYLETTLGAALDLVDAHTHTGTTHGLAIPYSAVSAVAFTAWTPAITQGGSSPTSTDQGSYYRQIGKDVSVTANITATSAGSAGNVIIISSLPIAPRLTGSFVTVGSFTLSRGSGGGIHVGSVIAATSTNLELMSSQTTGGYLGQANGPSFAVANGDVYSIKIQYEAS